MYNRLTMSPARRRAAGTAAVRLKLVVGLYVLAASLLPLAHHDIVCHIKSATHCPTCTIGSAGEPGSEPAMFGRFILKAAGDVVCERTLAVRSPAPALRADRAPPTTV